MFKLWLYCPLNRTFCCKLSVTLMNMSGGRWKQKQIWADSLMSLANSWIKTQIAQRTNEGDPCPLTIPQLRFVRGGVALVQDACHTREPGKLYYQPKATYLIKEVIPSELGEFTKYVHNVDATPQLPSFGGPAYDIAEFLCFVQHLQYWKTDAMVYISDFQGMWSGHVSNLLLAQHVSRCRPSYRSTNHDQPVCLIHLLGLTSNPQLKS